MGTKMNLELGKLPFTKILERLAGRGGEEISRKALAEELSNVRLTREDAIKILGTLEKNGVVERVTRDRFRLRGTRV